MNKKGFTLVEILAALLVLAILSGIAAISYTAIVRRAKTRSFEAYEKTMRAQAMEVLVESVTDNTRASLVPKNHGHVVLNLRDLKIKDFINPVNKDDLCPSSYVYVKRDDVDNSGVHVDAFEYKVCLICQQSDYITSDDCLPIPN
jgi:prepilin-type N-terminal cleavage/methylation domain-containing protein